MDRKTPTVATPSRHSHSELDQHWRGDEHLALDLLIRVEPLDNASDSDLSPDGQASDEDQAVARAAIYRVCRG